MNARRPWLALSLTLAALLAWLIFVWQPDTLGAPQPLPPTEVAVGGDFTLTSADGPVALADYRGQVVILYFGYTFCPDICPTSLSTIAQALALLTPGELKRVAGVFISVDPERDTMAVLKAYAPFFHAKIIGVSGTPEQVARVAQHYGARYMKQKPNADGHYAVDHSSFTSIVAADGRLAATLPHASSPQKIVATVRGLLGTSATD